MYAALQVRHTFVSRGRAQINDVSGECQPLLLEQLAVVAEHCDTECVSFFKHGAPFVGELSCSGVGDPLGPPAAAPSLDLLREGAEEHNTNLLRALHEDAHAGELMRSAVSDAKLGRMTMPTQASEAELGEVLLHPRFAVVQDRPDGSVKVRPVDNFSWSVAPKERLGKLARKRKLKEASLNGHCVPQEKLHHHHLDDLLRALAKAHEQLGLVFRLFKADIDAAYRRVPVMREHWWACAVVFLFEGVPWVTVHKAMPFGALAAVHAWERIGALLTKIGRKLLRISLFRYVDDFFGCERPALVEHALGCLVRLLKLLLGQSAVADAKVEAGRHLVILGVGVKVSKKGCTCRPAPEKVVKWVKAIDRALADDCLAPGDASKLAGRLSWSCQFMFRRVGRAMLRPLFMQKFAARPHKLSAELRHSLHWWRQVLRAGVAEKHPWEQPCEQIVHLFCDAAGDTVAPFVVVCLRALLLAGSPARIAAIAWVDGRVFYTDCEPPSSIVDRWADRADKQIMGLELLSIALALSTFEDKCAKRKVVIHSDNRGAECCLRKGVAKHEDHCALVNAIWTQALERGMQIWVVRIDTHDNWADSPSRREYSALQAVGAVQCRPCLADVYNISDTSTLVCRSC